MADVVPSFADRAAQLIADFQHAMDSNAPVSSVMMGELKSLLATGVSAHLECFALRNSAHNVEAKAAQLQSEASDLVATIHGGQ